MKYQIGKLLAGASVIVCFAALATCRLNAADQAVTSPTNQETELFKMDFTTAGLSIQDWTDIPIPKEASFCLKDGELVISVKALPALTADATTFISIDKIPKLPLDKPVKIEWRFRYKGAGLKSVDLTVKSSYNQENKRDAASKTIPIAPSVSNGFSDWQRGSVKVDSGKSKFSDISYWDLGLQFAPGADFVIEIDYIKVLPDDKP